MDARLVGDEERGNKMNDKLKNKIKQCVLEKK
jgi:hypothetical protein